MSIVNAMIAMGRGMNLTVIAEGVETEAQRARLQQMQCHEMQGYFFSAPLSGHAATALLGQHARGFAQLEHLAAS
jgi:EAL domain-containing protein (putative c-di-GMP-specific phosphodiesterase class I)